MSQSYSVSLLGSGKTGSSVINFFEKNQGSFEMEGINYHLKDVFNSKNVLKASKLIDTDFLIIFVPFHILMNVKDILLHDYQGQMIIGTTGGDFTSEFHDVLKKQKRTSIFSSNFSLGIRLIKNILAKEDLYLAIKRQENLHVHLHEDHHINKKDAPSGTLLTLLENSPFERQSVSFERKGDIVGDHKMTIELEDEVITIDHHAKSRSLFAKGAITALGECLNLMNDHQYGLYDWNKIQ